MNSRRNQFLAVLRIRPGETERVALMLLLSLLGVGGVVITGQLAARALFLSTQPASAIPLRFILPPLALVGAVALYSRFASRLGRVELTRATFVVIGIGALLVRALLSTPLHDNLAFLLGMFVFLDLAGALTMILFWTLAGDLFDAREARRLFGLISGGSALSNIAFGLFLGRIANSVQPADLLFVVAASLGAATLVVVRLGSRYPLAERASPRASATDGGAGSLRHDLGEVLSAPLMLTLSLLVVVIALVSNIAEFQLDLTLKTSFVDNGREMVEFLANFRLWAGIAAGLLQFLLAGALIERYGLLIALATLPLAIASGAVAILLTGGALWAVAIPRAADIALKYTISDSALNLLYLPLSPAVRARAKAIVDGVIKPPSVALLGVIFLAVTRSTSGSAVPWSIPVLVLVALWVGLLIRASRQYVGALTDSIVMRRLDPQVEFVRMSDPSSVGVLIAALRSTDALRVVHTLSLIREVPDVDWAEYVVPLLAHENADVRLAAIQRLAEDGAAAQVGRIHELFDDDDADVQTAAITAFCQLRGTAALEVVSPLLHDPSPQVRHAATAALIRFGGLGGILQAGKLLHELLESEAAAQRCEGADLLGDIGVTSFYGPLLDLLDDADASVRAAAVEAAGRIRAPELIPNLVPHLDSPTLQIAALRAIATCSSGSVEALTALSADNEIPVVARVQAIEKLGDYPDAATPILATHLQDSHAPVRSAAAATMLQMRRRGDGAPAQPTLIKNQLAVELRDAYERWLVLQDIGPVVNDHPLLAEALATRANQDRDRVIMLAGLCCADLPVHSIAEAMRGTDTRQRANALELIDNVVVESKELLLVFLGGTTQQRMAAATAQLNLQRHGLDRRIDELLRDDDAWIRTCALQLTTALDEAQHHAAIERACNDPDPRVRANAQAAAGRSKEVEPMALAPLEKVLFLKQVPMFRDIAGAEIHTILPIVEETRCAASEEILTQGDVGDSLYIIVEGKVGISIDGKSTDTVLSSRDVIGELALLTGDPRAATCTALTDVVALRLHRDPFWELLRQRPEVSLGVIQILLQYLPGR